MFTRTIINKGTVGLVFKNKEFTRFLEAGKHWLLWNEKVVIFKKNQPFYTSYDLEVLLLNEDLKVAVEIVEVADGEIVLRYENGNFKAVLQAGRYAFWKGFVDYKFVRVDLSKKEITEPIKLRILQRSELTYFLNFFVIDNHEKGMLFEDGKFVKMLTKGVHYFWKTPVPLEVKKADMRQLQLEVNGQEILTKDKAGVRANFVLQYRITDIEKAIVETNDYVKQLYVMTQLALREYMSSYTLDEVLEKKEELAIYIKKALAERAKEFGLTIIDGGMKDLILPGEVREIMNRVLVAQKQAQANTITRREETASTRSLLNTAKLLEENEMLFRLKEMEYVEKIADKITGITVSGDGKVLDKLRDIFAVSR